MESWGYAWPGLTVILFSEKNETFWVPGQPAFILWTKKLKSIKKKHNIQEQNGMSDFLLLTNIYTSTI